MPYQLCKIVMVIQIEVNVGVACYLSGCGSEEDIKVFLVHITQIVQKINVCD